MFTCLIICVLSVISGNHLGVVDFTGPTFTYICILASQTTETKSSNRKDDMLHQQRIRTVNDDDSCQPVSTSK